MPFSKDQYLDQNVTIKDRQVGSHYSLRLKEQIVAAYKKGYPIEAICKQSGLSSPNVYKILHEAKVPMRETPSVIGKGPKQSKGK